MIKFLIFLFPVLVCSQQLAFPDAVGHGRFATGGRGGNVVYVTNLSDTGAGSLRTALATSGTKTIIFRVGGTIDARSVLNVPANTTIAGQTAPGGGITISGGELRILGSNVIIRYIRGRLGTLYQTKSNNDATGVKAYSGNNISNVIFDHCEFTWSNDEVIELGAIGSTGSVQNITFQNCIIGENLGSGHQYGFILWNRATNVSAINNLLIHNSERNIRSSTCTSSLEMINNLIFNFTYGAVMTYENKFDIINNVYINPSGRSAAGSIIAMSPSLNNCPNGNIALTKAYVQGNTYNGSAASVRSNITPYQQGSRQVSSGFSPIASNLVEAHVLANVGVTAFSDDAVTTRLKNDVINRTFSNYKTSVAQAGGYPTIAGGTAYTDTDVDGMSDAYEDANSLDKNNAADRNAIPNSDGYTALENFLNYLAGDEAPETPADPTSIVIQGGIPEISVFEQEAVQLVFSVLPSGSNQSVNWVSSAPSIATVDVNGRVASVSEGVAIITATSSVDSDVLATIAVIVNANPPISTTPGGGIPRKIIINN
jgi:hypothetical protein